MTGRMMKNLLLVLLALFVCGSAGTASPYKPRRELAKFDPRYAAHKRELRARLKPLLNRMAREEARGKDVACARDLASEAGWLLGYTTRFDEAAERIEALKSVLATGAEPCPAGRQSRADGSWGCCRTWYLKLDATAERVMAIERAGMEPVLPLTLLDRINSPERLTAYLESILVSDPARTGVDNRKELNIATSVLVRFIQRGIPRTYAYHPGLRAALCTFVDGRWRNPRTGFWGAWYVTPKGVVRTDDLSITFHLASYREAPLEGWPRMFETLMAMRKAEYPNGWLQGGRNSTHHLYDVVRLMRLAWPYLDDGQRRRGARELRRIVRWCLADAVRPDGSFGSEADEGDPGNTFYFAVSLLDEAGVFDPAKRFWTSRALPGGQALRRRLALRLLREPRDSGASGLFLAQALTKLRVAGAAP
ncbi:MAG: hypothetical protein HY303_12425 [Candidatus Wallbacteria bacterium]|nr:hypothetical protein [Candidatus Wallbacteria bacterium]